MSVAVRRPDPDPAAWRTASFASPDEYTVTLTDAHRAELGAAVDRLAETGRLDPAVDLDAGDFELPELDRCLAAASESVRSGRGFVLIRGIPAPDLPHFTAAVWGLGTRFGQALSQNAQGERLGHVVDASGEDATPRMYRSKLELGLHNDVTAMISLACWNPARRGGTNVLASAVTVHDEIARRAPHLLEHLYNGFHYHLLGEEGPGQAPVTPFRVPIFAVRNGQVSCRNARFGYIAGHYEMNIPITDEEVEAIDLFDEIARERENHLIIPLERGDMIVINNYTVLHARTGFDEFDEPERRRHLLRLWLDAPGFRDVPKEFYHFGVNGIPYQEGRRCTYDFKAMAQEIPRRLLGFKPAHSLGERYDGRPATSLSQE